jgi:heat shock protein HslJ
MSAVLVGVFIATLAMASPQPPPLAGPEWRLVSLSGFEASALAGLKRPVRIVFRDGDVAGSLGCNSFGGPYWIDGGRVVFGALAGTMRACSQPAMSIENAMRKALTGSVPFTLAGTRLTLTAASGATLVFEAQPGAELDGLWQVTGLNNGKEAVATPRDGTSLTLRFRDGGIAGTAGCNTFRSRYGLDQDRIRIEGAIATRKACPPEVMEQERQFLAALETATRWSIREGRLELRRDDGALAVSAIRTR